MKNLVVVLILSAPIASGCGTLGTGADSDAGMQMNGNDAGSPDGSNSTDGGNHQTNLCDGVPITNGTFCLRNVDCGIRLEGIASQILIENTQFVQEHFTDADFINERRTPCANEQLVMILKPKEMPVTTTVELVSQIGEVGGTLAGIRTLLNAAVQFPEKFPQDIRVFEIQDQTTQDPAGQLAYLIAGVEEGFKAGLESTGAFQRGDQFLLRIRELSAR